MVTMSNQQAHPAGEVASGLAVEAVKEFLLHSPQKLSGSQPAEGQDALRQLEGAFRHAHARVLEDAVEHPEGLNMGTTLTVAWAVEWKAFVAHAGHSRCYLLSGGELRQLTHDHTIAAELVDLGVLSPPDAARHPYRRALTNVLEANKPGTQVELHTADLRPGDVLLLSLSPPTSRRTSRAAASPIPAARAGAQ
jgi:protein phosphatase